MRTFLRGWNIVEFVTCAALATAVGFAFVPHFVQSEERARMVRVRMMMRDTAASLAAYKADHGVYPPSGRADAPPTLTANSFASRGQGAQSQMTFRLPPPGEDPSFATLTAPVAYLQDLPEDPFAHTRGMHLGYYAPESGNGWMLFSVGPDRDENGPDGPGDIGPHVENLYDPHENMPGVWQLTVPLLNVTYDPSNGTFSNGDLWQVEGM